jgi:TPP-dependent pyruvate/acetoin dehydrogenase alpha subunit
MLRKMLEIRHFDTTAGEMFLRGQVKGSIHSYIGQEAIAVAFCTVLRHDDWITSTHRGHGHTIAKGGDPKQIMAEILGKETGYCKGRGGSMHVTAVDQGNLGALPIVASGLPIGVGAALSARMRGQDRVVVCFFGEGGTSQGTYHEAVNLAALWKLPVVFVCENNVYSVSTHVCDAVPVADLADRAKAYGIPGINVDANDLLAVYDVAVAAVDRARRGDGPSFVACHTYRLEGHYVGEPRVYRSRDEEAEARKTHDPLPRFRALLIDRGVVTAAEADALEDDVRQEIVDAVAFAVASPEPPADRVMEWVYA